MLPFSEELKEQQGRWKRLLFRFNYWRMLTTYYQYWLIEEDTVESGRPGKILTPSELLSQEAIHARVPLIFDCAASEPPKHIYSFPIKKRRTL